jgi:lipopolysaccharide export system permease protein
MKYRPSLIDRLILSELVPLFIGMAVLFTAVILIATSANLVSFLSQGIPFKIVVELIWFNILPWLVPTFPMAMLVASIFGFVRLSTQSEIVPLFAAGIPFRRLLIPVLIFSLLVTCVALYTNDTIAPYAESQFDMIKADAFHLVNATNKPFDLPPIYDHNHLTTLVHVEGGVDAAKNMVNVYVEQIDPGTGVPIVAIHAREARWEGGQNWQFIDGAGIAKGMIGNFGPFSIKTDQTPDDVAALANDPTTSTFGALIKTINRLKYATAAQDVKARNYDEVTLWDKITLPLACVIFSMIGAPLGLRPQRSAAMAFAGFAGLGIIFVYYALYQFMQVVGASGIVQPVLAAFLPDLLGLIAAVALVARSSS